MTAQDVAAAHYLRRRALSASVTRAVLALYDRLDVTSAGIDPVVLDRLIAVVETGQFVASSMADQYLDQVLVEQGIDPTPSGALVPVSLAGTASDGRRLASLLAMPWARAHLLVGDGVPTAEAAAAGRMSMALIAGTQVQDAGRAADQIAMAVRKHCDGYVRMVSGGSCSRCLLLAGTFYYDNEGFDRHPQDDCVHMPTTRALSRDLSPGPEDMFKAMSPAEQDRTFGAAGAQAIRDGADMGRVVNARRGMSTAGGRVTTWRSAGRFKSDRRPGRLMPEQIISDADGDHSRVVAGLKEHGYIVS